MQLLNIPNPQDVGFQCRKLFKGPGLYSWICPKEIWVIWLEIVAGGGGHSSNAGNPTWGGGGGSGYAGYIHTIPGRAYYMYLGAGGAGAGAGTVGVNGGHSYFGDNPDPTNNYQVIVMGGNGTAYSDGNGIAGRISGSGGGGGGGVGGPARQYPDYAELHGSAFSSGASSNTSSFPGSMNSVLGGAGSSGGAPTIAGNSVYGGGCGAQGVYYGGDSVYGGGGGGAVINTPGSGGWSHTWGRDFGRGGNIVLGPDGDGKPGAVRIYY